MQTQLLREGSLAGNIPLRRQRRKRFLVLFSRTQAGMLVLVITIIVLVWQSLEKDEGCLRTALLPHCVQHISSPGWLSFTKSCSMGKTSRKVSVRGWGWSLHSHIVCVCACLCVCVSVHVCMFMSVRVCMFMCVCVRVCMFMCVQEQRLEDNCHPSVTSHLVLWDKVSHWLGVCPLGWFGQPASLLSCLSFSLPSAGLTSALLTEPSPQPHSYG